jgi:pilus assembly protein CpaE
MNHSRTGPLRAVIAHRDEEQRRAITEALRALPDLEIAGEHPELGAALSLARQTDAQLLVLELPLEAEATFRTVSAFHVERPNTAVVYSSERLDADTVLRAMRSGAIEVLGRPLSRATLREAVLRVRSQREHDPSLMHDATVVTVFGAKGGCGVSTLATNLGVALAADGRGDIVLVDLDEASGDAAFLLGLSPARTLLDLAHGARIDSAALQDVMVRHASGLNVLAQPERRPGGVTLSASQTGTILDLLVTLFDVVVIDAPHTLDESVRRVLAQSTHIVFVVEPDVPSLRAARRALELLRQQGLDSAPSRLRLVVNRHEHRDDVTLEQVSETLGLPVYATVANDYGAANRSVNSAQPLTTKGGHGRLAHDLAALADLLVPARELELETVPAGAAPTAKPNRNGFLHLLRRSRPS